MCSREPWPDRAAAQGWRVRVRDDLTRALETQQRLQPGRTLLTHISHHLDLWLMDNELPPGLELAFDNLSVHCGNNAADRIPAP